MARPTLKRRVLFWLIASVTLLSTAIFSSGYLMHEHAELLTWNSLLQSELDSIVARSQHEPDYRWKDSSSLGLYAIGSGQAVPRGIATLGPGLHDDVLVRGHDSVVLVRDTPRMGRLALALDITDFEVLENFASRWIMVAVVAVIAITLLIAYFGMGRLVRPLSTLAEDIGRLRPEKAGQRIGIDAHASSELVVIADALNDYLQRNARFVERERVFIDSASHELRTPIAVIAGAAELALDQPDVPMAARNPLLRIRRQARSVEQLISLLLALAKDPARLVGNSGAVELHQLLPEIVADHQQLTRDKDLRVVLAPLPECTIVAPLAIVQAAIGNLLRNAIESSDSGEILVALAADATVTIADPGHGMSPEQISAIYARVARGGGARDGGGIGLDLISRLCEHLGWTLRIASDGRSGTTTTLRLSSP